MGNIFVDDATEEVTEKETEQDLKGTHTSDLEFQEFQKYTKMLEPIEVKTKHALPSPVRTQGDGMENIDEKTEPQVTSPPVAKISHTTLGDTLLYRPQKSASFSKPPPVITGKIVNLVPKTVSHPRKDKIVLGSLKGKEPKFVPYEPYKAAVNPIIPPERKNKSREKKCSIKSDVPLLIACAVPVETSKEAIASSNGEMDETSVSVCEWEKERKLLDDEIKQLKEENSQLESQLKFQAQVNGELKNLLVAAVGEDLETRVHILTEDKLQLARALLNSAQRLSTHQEQTEWLAGQCEVWRSKFLASSLMVEELARWKAALSQKATDLQETMKRLLEERVKVRETLLHAYRNLKVLCDNFDPVSGHSTRKCDLPSTNMIDLAAGNLKLSESLQLHLLGSQNNMKKKEVDVTGLDMQTCAEKMAEQLLKNHNNLLSGLPDIACSAVMGAAVAVGGQLFRHGGTPVSCCAHCSGEMKLV